MIRAWVVTYWVARSRGLPHRDAVRLAHEFTRWVKSARAHW